MKNFTNTIKFGLFALFLVLAFAKAEPVFAVPCPDDGVQLHANCGGSDYNDDDDDDDNDSDNVEVRTDSATDVDENSAELNGEITDLDQSEDYERWFEWGTDDDDLDETASVSGTTDDEGEFSRTIGGLSDDREYFYRACAEEEDGGDEDCGSIRSFTTDEDDDNDDDDNDDDNDDDDSDGEGSVITTDASAVTSNSAILNGVVINESGSQRVWFEYGRTVNLGNVTASRNVSGDENLFSLELNGLSSSQAYFFRLVSDDGEEGDLRSFVTKSGVTYVPPSPTTPAPTTPKPEVVIINSGQFLNVDLIASVKEVKAGDEVIFQVVYENLTKVALTGIRINVNFPPGITPKHSAAGTFTSKQNIEVVIPTLGALDKGDFAIDAEIERGNEKFLVSVIEANYNHPTLENTMINTIDYSILKFVGGRSDQAAGALFAGGIFPIPFWGWLIIIAIITVLIVLAHKKYKETEDKKSGLKIVK